uniref:Glycosyltransferase 2-like domain-containing protein n=1 Tax=Ditylenchus dipsaci TaxID=166011 RepID=A0A915E937_9BILA
MIDTLNSIASQPDAILKISAFVGLEEGTPDKDGKSQELHDLFSSKLERLLLLFTQQICLVSLSLRDIPGKCSNFNYSARASVKKLRAENVINSSIAVLVTTGDCDTVFGERYFDALEEDYWKTDPNQRNRTVWQSPLFYCINLDKSPFFVRVTGLLRSFFMMGYLIPWNINTMSVFSLILKLFEDGEYTHPGYQMDDIIALIRWTCAVGQKCIIRVIPVATLSGPTSGSNYINELYEWARQIRRWTIGAAEVFHYFMIKSKKLPFGVSLMWALRFIFYYGFVLCIGSIYSIVAPIATIEMLTLVNHPTRGLFLPNETIFHWILLGMFALQYFWFFCVFLVNHLAEAVFPGSQKDGTGFLRSIFHWLMTWPTITAYCFIEVFAFLEVTVREKKFAVTALPIKMV